ncbi:hypothetical protein M231_05157 [Tremella mesenterica]|uniref:RNA polymerase II elongation factor ELL N-terminal domain-containing protein n=1 Tax=Tremella mesenterica TaxID=5217 RepID=A0A4Q1BIZ9_TREME|nr:hypothetical protein M231_05157 [Tremella mesenterica]
MILPPQNIPLRPPTGVSKQALLIRLPQETLDALIEAQEDDSARVWMDDGVMKLDLPDECITLDSHMVDLNEIHLFTKSPPALTHIATASARACLPLSSQCAVKAGEKLKQHVSALDEQRKARAEMVDGSSNSSKPRQILTPQVPSPAGVSAAMNRVQSSPATIGAATGTTPIIPLKTRVMQTLALGPISASELILRVAGNEVDVMRVANVIGRSSGNPPKYTLLPQQYTKIKITAWRYTPAEKRQVIHLARLAFDELGFSPGSQEHLDLDKVEAETEASPILPTPEIHKSPVILPTISRESHGHSLSMSTSGRSNSPSDSSISIKTQPPPPKPSKSVKTIKTAKTTSPVSQQSLDDDTRKPTKASVPIKPKVSKTPKTLIGKARAKHLAEANKRASSLPNNKKLDDASVPIPSPTAKPLITKPRPPVKRKSPEETEKEKEKEKEETPIRQVKKRRPSPQFSDSSEEERGRPKETKITSVIPPPRRESISSSDKLSTPPDDIRRLPKITKRTPMESVKIQKDLKNEEAKKRRKYERLYGEYGDLTRRLVNLHRRLEEMEDGEDVGGVEREIKKTAGEFKALHDVLQDLRRYFVDE